MEASMKNVICGLFLSGLPLLAGAQAGAPGGKASARFGVREAQLLAPAQPSKPSVRVDCGNPAAKVRTIADGLATIGDERPATLLVSGTCRENVLVQGLDHVTVQGNPTATIDGGADPSLVAVTISDSRSIQLTSLAVTGGGIGVACVVQSLCRLTQVTVQNSLGTGVSVGVRSEANIDDSVIQNSAGAGLSVRGGTGNLGDVTIAGNAASGVQLDLGGGFLAVSGGSISGNGGNGITAIAANFVFLGGATVSDNAGDGVALQAGSTANLRGSEISGNAGHQVRIGDLSSAVFGNFNAVFGTTSPDVVCDPVFSATRGLSGLSGTTTNCPPELPPTP
jgi:parallel beta helix pectate lyase-like protein